jgi:glycosyltransferase involved in cell wall biosynthesis
VWVVIPARNESRWLGPLIRSLPARIDGCGAIVPLVVDDGSVDGTATIVADRALVVRHRSSRGKGAALKTGCDVAVEHGCDVIAMMDGDGQHHPGDLPAVVGPLLRGQADLSLGFRQFSGQMPVVARVGNRGLSGAFAVLFGRAFQDTQCGLRACTGRAYEMLRWTSDGSAVETEMLVRAVRCHLRVAEVSIQTIYHDRHKGTTLADGMRIVGDMVRWRFSRGLDQSSSLRLG